MVYALPPDALGENLSTHIDYPSDGIVRSYLSIFLELIDSTRSSQSHAKSGFH
jgi:hypothetical protein